MQISVITPVKNGAEFLVQAIESIVNQAGDFTMEYIIVDGGSTDATLEIANNYATQINTCQRRIFCEQLEVKVVSQTDNSMYDALSTGLKLAKGDVICYLNADDIYLPNAFNCVVDIFTRFKNIEWLTGFPVRYNESGNIIRSYIPFRYNNQLILEGFYGDTLNFIQQESVFWRRDLNKHIDTEVLESFKLAGDYFLWHSFAKATKTLFVVESLLGGNRIRPNQLSAHLPSYFAEFNAIKNKSSFKNSALAFVYGLIEKYCGQSIKRRLGTNRVWYGNGVWNLK